MSKFSASLICGFFFFSASPGNCKSQFGVDGVVLGDVHSPTIAHAISNQRLHDPTGFCSPANHQVKEHNGRVTLCIGSSLQYAGLTIGKRLQRGAELSKKLGQPDHLEAYLGLGDEAPILKQIYFREDCVIEVAVTNPGYLKSRCPAFFRRHLSDRIWRFRIWALDQ